ncbi:OLAH [Branchiostoma lanceolatum]|uniref:S-acyl fatty acid synthase thioesterase, medium chain n=1 Tax=Branchiostoma lanceolatum TaxID=7740 RepID=A0A8J9VYB2_BRALA|nr:OLAH [Branchiostoma lanceolatum]
MSRVMDKLLACRFRHPDAAVRLFCFPWAGGGSGYYNNWGKLMPGNVEVYSLRLPGRETRLKEPCHKTMEALTNDISTTLLPKLKDKPFAFFGHSMGAFTAFEVARYLQKWYGLQPQHLFVSGVSAPQSPLRYQKNRQPVSEMSEEAFLDYIRQIGGTPEEILQNKGMMKLFLPPLRADLELLDAYNYQIPDSGPELSCPVTCFDGTEDRDHDQDAWFQLTSHSAFQKTKLPGGHFYLLDKNNQQTLLKHILQTLENI